MMVKAVVAMMQVIVNTTTKAMAMTMAVLMMGAMVLMTMVVMMMRVCFIAMPLCKHHARNCHGGGERAKKTRHSGDPADANDNKIKNKNKHNRKTISNEDP